jgi:thiol-disulfide isomerase/thioredoxin
MRAGRRSLLLLLPLLVVGTRSASAEGDAIPTRRAPAAAPVAPPAVAPDVVPARAEGDGVPDTLEALATRFTTEEKAARAAVLRRRHEATRDWVARHPTSSDLEQARGELVTTAFDAEAWELVAPSADDYLRLHVTGPLVPEVRYCKAVALGRLGRGAECRRAYDELTRTVNLKQHSKGVVMRAFTAYAGWLAEQGDVAGAQGQWAMMRAVFQTIPDGKPFINMAEDESQYLGQVGRDAIPFPAETRDLEGRPVSLAAYRGRWVLIDFWATWCKPCIEELPYLQDAYRRHHGKGLEIVGVVVNEPTDRAKVSAFVAERRIPWPQVHFTEIRNPIQQAYGVRGVPFAMLVGPDGKIVRTGLRGADLRSTLDRIFSNR